MTTVVLDSSNTEAVLADAIGATQDGLEVSGGSSEKKADEKPEGKDDDKSDAKETKQESDAENKGEPNPDDVEGDDGVTARQKRELSSKMLKVIGKKHRELKEAEEFAAAQYSERQLAEERAQRIQAQLDALKAEKKPVEEAIKPERAKFATDEEYVEAFADWKVDQKMKERDAEQARQTAERAQAELLANAGERIAKAIELVPDFAEVTGAVTEIVPAAVAGYMQESDMFAELGYHLAKHPELVVSLQKLKPAQQLVQIGKIEAILKPFSESKDDSTHGGQPSKAVNEGAKPRETTGKFPSKARNTAPVIQPLNTNGAVVERDPVHMNIRETISDWQKRNNANLALRKRH